MPRTPEQFVRSRQESWTRLEELVDRAQTLKIGALSDGELLEMGTLYRRVSSDLARAQTRYSSTLAGRELVRSLNSLILRAHAQVYSAPAPQASNFWHFVLYGFPAAFRRNFRPILLAAFFLYGPAVIAYFSVWTDPANARLFVTEDMVRSVEERAKKKLVTGWGANTSYKGISSSPATSSEIMTNNIRVSALALALGVTAGIGTVWALVSNGLLIGALAGVATNYKTDLLFWSVILPHGVLELTAICIAGGAGFVLARAIYAPGDLSRRDALRLAGTEAGQLLMGVVLFLVFAGIIEGFLTPTALPPVAKLTFAALSGVIMLVYLSLKAPVKKTGIL
ncbi:stage II sporulation protein M [bacterium]|nr:MAG: stage II sporulation protein M [bacterium]